MNINGLTSSISSARALGARLDLTSNIQASERSNALNKTSSTMQQGSIPGVLTEEENQAFTAMFQAIRQNIYTSNGTAKNTSATPIPGAHLDIQA